MIAEHTLDIYGVTLHLVTTRTDLTRLRKRLDFLPERIEDSGLTQFAQVYRQAGSMLCSPHVVIWVDEAQHADTAELVETYAHEAAHAAGQICEYISHPVTANDEPFAWLVGWITRWLWSQADAVG